MKALGKLAAVLLVLAGIAMLVCALLPREEGEEYIVLERYGNG